MAFGNATNYCGAQQLFRFFFKSFTQIKKRCNQYKSFEIEKKKIQFAIV